MNLSAIMGQMTGSKKVLQASGEPGTKNSAFKTKLQSLVNSSDVEGLNKDLFGSIQQLLQSMPEDALKLNEDMLASLKQSDLWEGLSQQLKQSLEQLFNNESSLKQLIQGESDLKDSQNLLALFGWFQTSNLQNVKDVQQKQISSELKSTIQSLNLSGQKESESLKGWQQTLVLSQKLKNASNEVQQTQLTKDQKVQLQELAQKLQNTFEKMAQVGKQQGSEVTKLEKQMFQLAKQWLQLEKQANVSANERPQMLESLKQQGVSQKGTQLWDKMLSTLQKRQSFSSMNQYGTESKVTYKEFSKWMQKAWQGLNASIESQRSGGKQVAQNVITTTSTITGTESKGSQQMMSASMDSMPMSKQEQYVIKLNTGQQDTNNQKQLIDQFQKVMNRSRFISNQQGQQLSIKLSPGNLGDMMVRMTQQNGEMMVKIMVSSQTTKEMLEGNLQQLRHMFSPNQVVVEKQDLNVNSQQNMHFQKEQDEYSEDQYDSQSAEDNQEQDQQDDDSEVLDFHELLMEEESSGDPIETD